MGEYCVSTTLRNSHWLCTLENRNTSLEYFVSFSFCTVSAWFVSLLFFSFFITVESQKTKWNKMKRNENETKMDAAPHDIIVISWIHDAGCPWWDVNSRVFINIWQNSLISYCNCKHGLTDNSFDSSNPSWWNIKFGLCTMPKRWPIFIHHEGKMCFVLMSILCEIIVK